MQLPRLAQRLIQFRDRCLASVRPGSSRSIPFSEEVKESVRKSQAGIGTSIKVSSWLGKESGNMIAMPKVSLDQSSVPIITFQLQQATKKDKPRRPTIQARNAQWQNPENEAN